MVYFSKIKSLNGNQNKNQQDYSSKWNDKKISNGNKLRNKN